MRPWSSTGRLSQVFQQCLCIHQVARLEAFGEPGIERGEDGAGGGPLAMVLPAPPGWWRRERLGLLPPGDF